MKIDYLVGVLLLLTIILPSCEDKAFIKLKSATKKSSSLGKSSLVRIKSYYLIYNPKSNGSIKLKLESGAEYQAKPVDGGSFSSINSLLKEPDVLFDTTRKELVIDKPIQK